MAATSGYMLQDGRMKGQRHHRTEDTVPVDDFEFVVDVRNRSGPVRKRKNEMEKKVFRLLKLTPKL